jgi:hypothetical protein
MKYLTISFLFLYSAIAHSNENAEFWEFNGKTIELKSVKGFPGIFNEACLKEKKCEALIEMEKLSKIEIPIQAYQGGKNPGAVICHFLSEKNDKIMVVFGRNLNGNVSSFCKFSDGSIVSVGALLRAKRGD